MKKVTINIDNLPADAVAIEYNNDGSYIVWTNLKIRRAFAFGAGTMADFRRYVSDNKKFANFEIL